ncbi:MAG: tRNA dihydrouridine(20/20a) synthase DusA [Pseudomonadota bacterium]
MRESGFDKTIAVAPMMDWTDRHCRFLHRLLSPSAVLYTEMVTAAALTYGDSGRLLAFNAEEHPVVLQVGGSDPVMMADAAELGEQAGYDAININVGCPSDRVQSGRFGACLMAEPQTVAACFSRMCERVNIPVTVKTRLGIDDQDSDAFFNRFIDTVADAGCVHFDVHARIAVLSGLSPKQNREVPPLNYERVFELKQRRPELRVLLNGGIRSADDAREYLERVDGIMIGREAYQNPWSLTAFERLLKPEFELERFKVVADMVRYAERIVGTDRVQLKHITRHMLGLFAGEPGAKQWRRTLSERAHLPEASAALIDEAATFVSAA